MFPFATHEAFSPLYTHRVVDFTMTMHISMHVFHEFRNEEHSRNLYMSLNVKERNILSHL